MDIKSAFLNEIMSEKVYVEQPKGFEDLEFPNHVYRLNKALYGLKLALRAWYERLTTYLLEKKFKRRGVDRTLFIYRSKDELLVAQIYVNYIVFGAKEMKTKFKMSMVSELTFFLGLHIR